MIILIEGPRGSGKSHLTDNFFKKIKEDRFIYYKFAFSNWLEKLKIDNLESKPEVHYFSISNILTIFDVHNKFFKDKTIIMDRSILSAYVWSIYRNRVPNQILIQELKSFLNSTLYKGCKIIYVTKKDESININRNSKDMFDKYENYIEEKNVYDNLIDLLDLNKSVDFFSFNNCFDKSSEKDFNKIILNISKNNE